MKDFHKTDITKINQEDYNFTKTFCRTGDGVGLSFSILKPLFQLIHAQHEI